MSVAFTPGQPGTSESAWLQSKLIDTELLCAPTQDDAVVIVSAHPDDESLGAGGLIATAAGNGARVRLVVATDGEASHPNSATHEPARLSRLRRREVMDAAAALAPGLEPVFLGISDGTLSTCRTALRDRLAELVGDATIVVTPWVADGHPDHEACAAVVAELLAERADCAHWQYPIWAWHWARPDDDVLSWHNVQRLELSEPVRAAKRVALAAHRSQHLPLSDRAGDEAILPPHVLTHFDRRFETFVLTPRHPAERPEYFDALYSDSADPWGLADRFYEQRKRELLLATLPRRHFERAFEPGCATGELTERLCERCAEVVAWDGAAAAVAATRKRLRHCPRVRVDQGRIPAQWPQGQFDLIVLSEVGYYCTDLAELTHRLLTSLAADGTVVACHWRRAAPDHPQTAEAVHAALGSGLRAVAHHEEGDFILDVWSRDGRSVAQAEGIVT